MIARLFQTKAAGEMKPFISLLKIDWAMVSPPTLRSLSMTLWTPDTMHTFHPSQIAEPNFTHNSIAVIGQSNTGKKSVTKLPPQSLLLTLALPVLGLRSCLMNRVQAQIGRNTIVQSS